MTTTTATPRHSGPVSFARLQHAAWLLVLLGIFFGAKWGRTPAGPYSYDESDYMYAAEQGVVANAFDTPSRSLWSFIQIGLSAVEGEGGGLSQLVRSGVDINFYRHTHGPLYYYWLSAVGHWFHSETGIRTSTLIFPLLTALVIYLGCLWVVPAPSTGAAALLSTALYLWSPTVVQTFALAPHLTFALCVIASLFFAAKALMGGPTWSWYGAMTAAGLAFASLEVTFVLIATLAVVGWMDRQRFVSDRKLLVRCLAVFLGTVLVAWPAAILKLAFAKSYLFMAYLAVGRRAAWGTLSNADVWNIRFLASPVEWILIGLAMAAWCARTNRNRYALPFLVFGLLMTAVMFRVNSPSLHYAIPFEPMLDVYAGLTLAALLVRIPSTGIGRITPYLAAALIAGNLAIFLQSHPVGLDTYTPAMLQAVRDQGLEDKRLLVPQNDLPIVHYYFRQTTLTGFSTPEDMEREFSTGKYDAVLPPGETRFTMARLQTR